MRLSVFYSFENKSAADFMLPAVYDQKNKTVNNVGVSHEFPADFVDTSPEELARIINVNVTATLRVTSLIAPSMVSRFVFSLP